jgi:dihydrofolate reductase
MSTVPGAIPPRLEIVVAVARNGVIGSRNQLPWHLPDDLKRFKRLTLGHPVLMGRRTWESIGRPLPGRQNIVISRTQGYEAPGATVVAGLEAAIAAAGAAPVVSVIGGAELFRLCLPRASVLHLTEIEAEPDGDVRFPEWSRSEWLEVAREAHAADARHPYPFSFVTLERRAR